MTRCIGAVAGVALVFLVGLAHVSVCAAASASIQAVVDADGNGKMIANSQTNPADETWSWKACSPSLKNCTPFASGRAVETVGAPVPSVFRATSSHGATALTPKWNGRVTRVSPPSIAGAVRANELVIPIPGQWRGGWTGDVDWTQLAACKGPHDEGCTTLTDMHYVDGCSNGAAVIDPRFTGMYLRVADWRVSSQEGILDYGVGTPYSPNIWLQKRVISVAIAGRIQPATGPAATGCGPFPLVAASISNRGVANVRCERSCRITVIASQGERRARASRKLVPSPRNPHAGKTGVLQIRPSKLRRFKRGAVHIAVVVNGRTAATRVIHLSG